MLKRKVESFLGEKIVSYQSIGGGCIAKAEKIITESNKSYFLKSSGDLKTSFRKEANGLKEIKLSQSVLVPDVISVDNDYLLLEYIDRGIASSNFFEDFGRSFANLHRYSSNSFGFFEDNYIGSTPQLNIPNNEEKTNWALFYFNKRLKFQVELAIKNGYINSDLIRLFSKLEEKIVDILNANEAPSLLHGDLWNGNFMVNRNGCAVIFDPAVYYGHREADLAMTKLFGGFSESFYSAYNELFPLERGWEYRENIYKLYHMLNHLNLFGRGYYRDVKDLLCFYV